MDLYTVSPLGNVWTGSGWTARRLKPIKRSTFPPTSLGTFRFCRALTPLALDFISSYTLSRSTTFISAVIVSIVSVLATWLVPSFSGSRVAQSPEAMISPPPATDTGIGPLMSFAETNSVSGTFCLDNIVLQPLSTNAWIGLVFPSIKQNKKTHCPLGYGLILGCDSPFIAKVFLKYSTNSESGINLALFPD